MGGESALTTNGTRRRIAILPGDGIGPEIIDEAVKILELLNRRFALDAEWAFGEIGGAGYDAAGSPYPEATRELVRGADAVLLGAVGGPRWEALEKRLRPESGLLAIRAGR